MRYNYFVPSGYHEFVQKCLNILRNREPGVILFAPKTDRPRRINQMIQDYQNEIPLFKIELAPSEINDIDDVIYLLKQNIGEKITKDVGVIISNCELLINEKNYSVIEEIIGLQEKDPHLRFLLFFEVDITHPDIAQWFTLTYLYSNIVYYPLYEYEDAAKFIDYNLDLWNFKIGPDTKHKIIERCGGHFWLIRQALRSLRDNPELQLEEIFRSPPMRFRLEQLYYLFLDSEKRALQKVLKDERMTDDYEKHSFEHLKRMGFIKDNEISIPLLSSYIRENMPKVTIEITNNKVLLNNINVDSHFSKKERRAFKKLLEHKGHIVDRDEIAKALWPIDTEKNYSDWAVDRVIARLRNKLLTLGFSKEIIKTVRNRGYLLTN